MHEPGIETLTTVPISKSSAMQRAGRAGREGPGLCFRLYTEASYRALRPSAPAEALRCNLVYAVLQLKALGQPVNVSDFMDPPDMSAGRYCLHLRPVEKSSSHRTVQASYVSLFMIGAFDGTLSITPTGTRMATLPLDPHLARSLLESQAHGCTSEVLTLISLLSTTAKVLYNPSYTESREAALDARRKFVHRTGDHLTLLNIYKAYEDLTRADCGKGHKQITQDWCRRHCFNERAIIEAQRIRNQLHDLCARVGLDPSSSCGEETEPILRSLLVGLAHNAAYRQSDGTYKDISNGSVCCVFLLCPR